MIESELKRVEEKRDVGREGLNGEPVFSQRKDNPPQRDWTTGDRREISPNIVWGVSVTVPDRETSTSLESLRSYYTQEKVVLNCNLWTKRYRRFLQSKPYVYKRFIIGLMGTNTDGNPNTTSDINTSCTVRGLRGEPYTSGDRNTHLPRGRRQVENWLLSVQTDKSRQKETDRWHVLWQWLYRSSLLETEDRTSRDTGDKLEITLE